MNSRVAAISNEGAESGGAENSIAKTKTYFPNLDGLRFFSFLIVFTNHTFFNLIYKTSFHARGTFVERIVKMMTSGETGMSIFFVLSGFLISYLIMKEIKDTGRFNVTNFFIRRILRIWPLYYAVVLFAVVIYPYIKLHVGDHEFVGSPRPFYYFAFLSNYDQLYMDKFYPTKWILMQAVTWSVSVEEQFYLLWPMVFLIVPKRYYLLAFITALIFCFGFRLIHVGDMITLYFHLFAIIGDFAVGAGVAYLALNSERFRHFFSQQITKQSIILVYLLGVLWLFLIEVPFHVTISNVFTRFISSLFFAFIIYEQAISKNSFYKFSHNRFFTFWGKYTYGLYLLHPIAMWLGDMILWRAAPHLNTESFNHLLYKSFIALALSLLLAYFSYELFEKKFLRLKERFDYTRR